MNYHSNRNGVFAAATSCAETRKPVQCSTELLNEPDATRAFDEWKREFPHLADRVDFRFTRTADGRPIAAFAPKT